jgi:hypothetical protein
MVNLAPGCLTSLEVAKYPRALGNRCLDRIFVDPLSPVAAPKVSELESYAATAPTLRPRLCTDSGREFPRRGDSLHYQPTPRPGGPGSSGSPLGPGPF